MVWTIGRGDPIALRVLLARESSRGWLKRIFPPCNQLSRDCQFVRVEMIIRLLSPCGVSQILKVVRLKTSESDADLLQSVPLHNPARILQPGVM